MPNTHNLILTGRCETTAEGILKRERQNIIFGIMTIHRIAGIAWASAAAQAARQGFTILSHE